MTNDKEHLMEFGDESGGLGAIQEEGASEAVHPIQSPHSEQGATENTSTDVVSNPGAPHTIFGQHATFVHAALDGSATDNYDTGPFMTAGFASLQNSPSGEAATPGSDSDRKTPDNNEPPVTETALPLTEQENRIDRLPDNSLAPDPETQRFSPTRLAQLFTQWDNNALAFLKSYAARCEIVYEIHKETAKPGCKGGFSQALRRLKLAASTANDMVNKHKVKIGEMEEPGPLASRDGEDQEEEGSEESKSESGDTPSRHHRSARRSRSQSSPRIAIALSGKIAEAVTAIQTHYHQPNAAEVIKFCVLRVWGDLEMPLGSRAPESSSIGAGPVHETTADDRSQPVIAENTTCESALPTIAIAGATQRD